MANEYTTDLLLTSMKKRGMIPASTNAFSTTDLLRVLTEEMRTYIVEMLVSANEEYGVTTYDVSIASGTSSYVMPPRASGMHLRGVYFVDSSGNEAPLDRIEPSRAGDYGTSGSIAGYKLENNSVVVVPSPSATSGTLRMRYFYRPNKLVETTAVGLITAINTSTRVVTVSTTIPTTFTTSVTYDLVKGQPGFQSLGIDLAVSAAAATSMTFSVTLPTGLAVGDYVCLAGQSPIPQIPPETHILLAHRAAQIVLEGVGDPRSARAEATTEKMRQKLMPLLTPRVKAGSRIIVNRNGPGWGN